MMDRTDRHFRFLLRCVSSRVLLTTEMVTMHALLRGDPRRHLVFHPSEHPLSLQLGGDDPQGLAACARMAAEWLRRGGPERGLPQRAGAERQLRRLPDGEPERVRDCVAAMRESGLPVTVKHRIGFDDHDDYAFMLRFVDTVAQAGPTRFAVHARKAWLKGLSPKENRNIPPLRYEEVHRLKRERPELEIVLNGGIRSIDQGLEQLQHVDGVMIGRALYDEPMAFAELDRRAYGSGDEPITRVELVGRMAEYASWEREQRGTELRHIARHMMGLFQGIPGARAWRRHISQVCMKQGAAPQTLLDGLELLSL